MKKIFLIFVFLLTLSGLFINTQPARAFLDIPYNITTMQLDGLDWVEDSILKFLVLIFLLVVESTAFVFISAGLLDWASSLPSGLDQTLVTTGWGFTSGLANMFFILIFIVIAFSYFFKEDTWHMQKALPRLIAVALLINFSLFLVGMMVDTGWIVQNSFRSVFFGKEGSAVAAVQPLKDMALNIIFPLITAIPLGYLGSVLIPVPWLSSGALAAVGFMALSGGMLFGTISQTILLIIFNFTTGLIFLAYAILFLVRIGFIWLLAITAPLAFMAFVLPQTEKYFKQWLEALFKWTFLGVIVFFLMGLGLKLFSTFPTGNVISMTGKLGIWDFSETYYKYIFLLVYLVVAFTAVKKFMPAGTEMAWSLAGMARDRGVKFAAEQIKKRGMGLAAEWERGTKETAKTAAEKLKRGGQLTVGERLRLGVWARRPEQVERVGLRAEAREKGLTEKILVKAKESVLKGAPKEAEDRRNYLREKLLTEESKGMLRSSENIAAIIDIMTKEGKIGEVEERFIGEAVKRGVDPDKILERRPDLAKKIGRSVTEVLEKINAEDFRKKVQKEAFKDTQVVIHVLKDESKFRDIERNAKIEIKKEILNTLNTSTQPIDPQDLPLITQRINEISRSPRWRV